MYKRIHTYLTVLFPSEFFLTKDPTVKTLFSFSIDDNHISKFQMA